MPEKTRLDVALARSGLARSREQARALILSGGVRVGGVLALKPSLPVQDGEKIEVSGAMRYVSRGGLKLEKALKAFCIDIDGRVCIDVGASTGGFTDCMLQNGAAKVYAVDVGAGQLDKGLRGDPRVVNIEKTNFRYMQKSALPEQITFASVDVSFISLKIILNVLYEFLSENGEAVCLIKPQFEAGRGNIGKNGVIKSRSIHINIIKGMITHASNLGFNILDVEFSPVKGPEGNIEYLLHIKRGAGEILISETCVISVVESAHKEL